MKFKISSGLKDQIGKELIIDDNVAIFELVKNSYDAGAKKVKIVFKDMRSNNKKIYIIDNGDGMSRDDIEKKWLFVAFSEKKNLKNYSKKQRLVAGSKGIGRFSCDRLGSKLKIYSKIGTDKNFNFLSLNWEDFEKNQSKEFKEIDVNLSIYKNPLEDYGTIKTSGTIVEISDLRDEWDWKKMLKLKRYLQRLINPIQIPCGDSFEIELIAKDFVKDDVGKGYEYDKVNGKVENIVYEKLKVKTTTIECNISEKGNKIITKLNDKGVDIFELEEDNIFSLKDVNVKISYANAQAKTVFKKLMGVDLIGYGNAFVFKNGFRVFPYGEEDNDWLLINKRKSQGYARYLGTREIIGRIEISDPENKNFKETTSRSEGLISNIYFNELKELVLKYAIKRLEKYVVGAIDWDSDRENDPNKEKKDLGEVKKDSLKIIKQIAGGSLKNSKLKYNKDFLEIVEKKTMEKIPVTIKNIENISKKEKDPEVKKLYTQQIQYLKQGLKLQKEKEKEERSQQKKEIEEKEKEISTIETENIFLKSTGKQDINQLISLFHHIGIHSDTIKTNSGNLFKILKDIEGIPEKAHSQLGSIAKVAQMINTISKIGYKGGITEQMEKEKQDLFKFTEEFIKNICIPYYTGIKINVKNEIRSKFIQEFIPFEITYMIDNFISNSKKANASEINFNFSKEKEKVILEITDDGKGLNSKINKIDDIFKRNVSTTRDGAGLGLYDARKIVNKIGGKIVAQNLERGFKIKITF